MLAMTAPDSQRICWLQSTADAPRVLQAVAGEMAAAGYPEDDVFAVCLGLNEALLNAVLHGNGRDPAKRVRVSYRVTAERVLAEVEDEGRASTRRRSPTRGRRRTWSGWAAAASCSCRRT
jgi:anti-sigma regulatory factor (Ser/Thr protein kinase)